jgi:hypothetical protein
MVSTLVVVRQLWATFCGQNPASRGELPTQRLERWTDTPAMQRTLEVPRELPTQPPQRWTLKPRLDVPHVCCAGGPKQLH